MINELKREYSNLQLGAKNVKIGLEMEEGELILFLIFWSLSYLFIL